MRPKAAQRSESNAGHGNELGSSESFNRIILEFPLDIQTPLEKIFGPLNTSWEGLSGFQTPPHKVFGGFWKTRVLESTITSMEKKVRKYVRKCLFIRYVCRFANSPSFSCVFVCLNCYLNSLFAKEPQHTAGWFDVLFCCMSTCDDGTGIWFWSEVRLGKGKITLWGTNISHPKVVDKMRFLSHWWDMLVPWRV